MSDQDSHAATSGEPGGEEEHGVSGGRNPTQERMDEEGTDGRPVDVDWEQSESAPHEGEEGTDIV